MEQRISIVCGKGNNGGDGLALARKLHQAGYDIIVYYVAKEGSADYQANWQALPEDLKRISLSELQLENGFQGVDVLVDALFGSGLNRPPEGQYAEWIRAMNRTKALKLAIDLPSGLLGDKLNLIDFDSVFRADYCLTFQYPKRALVHPFSAHLAGQVVILDIGLHPDYLQKAQSNWYWQRKEDIEGLFSPRLKHSYKGDYGHALLFCGAPQTMGAALIAAEAALRSGVGLLSLNLPEQGFVAANARLPEAMLNTRAELKSLNLNRYTALLMGPGLGITHQTEAQMEYLLKQWQGNLVLDADALNMLASHPQWFDHLPKGTLLTPHPGEYRRLIGLDQLGPDQLEPGLALAKRHAIYILLKGSISTLICPDGDLHFFDWGSAALAKGGSGDLLAGCITAFLAQGKSTFEAVAMGLYLQGGAAQKASNAIGTEAAVLSSDILKQLGKAFPQQP